MVLEDRRHERMQVNYEDTNDCFHLEVYDRRYVLNRIHDISVSGTGIQVHDQIEPGTPVKLVLRSGGHSISVNGTTVWSDPITSGAETAPPQPTYRTGIQFDPRDRSCSLFFMALRDFISGRKKTAN